MSETKQRDGPVRAGSLPPPEPPIPEVGLKRPPSLSVPLSDKTSHSSPPPSETRSVSSVSSARSGSSNSSRKSNSSSKSSLSAPSVLSRTSKSSIKSAPAPTNRSTVASIPHGSLLARDSIPNDPAKTNSASQFPSRSTRSAKSETTSLPSKPQQFRPRPTSSAKSETTSVPSKPEQFLSRPTPSAKSEMTSAPSKPKQIRSEPTRSVKSETTSVPSKPQAKNATIPLPRDLRGVSPTVQSSRSLPNPVPSKRPAIPSRPQFRRRPAKPAKLRTPSEATSLSSDSFSESDAHTTTATLFSRKASPLVTRPSKTEDLKGVAKWEARVLELVNATRAENGVHPVRVSVTLGTVARRHNADQAFIQRGISHTGSDNSTVGDRLRKGGYRFIYASENVAVGQHNPKHVHRSLMRSPGHARNILSPKVTDMGLHVGRGADGRLYWTQLFGKRRGVNRLKQECAVKT